jgi:hypothetical protein
MEVHGDFFKLNFNLHSWGGESKLGPLGTSATEWPIVPAPGDYDDGEIGGMKIGRGNRSTRRKPAPAPLCPPQIPLDQTRVRTRATAVGSQRLVHGDGATQYGKSERCIVTFAQKQRENTQILRQ